MVRYEESKYGFNYGSSKVERLHYDPKKGSVWLGINTPKAKYGRGIQIYVTKTGKVRIYDDRGEWMPPDAS